MTMTDPIADMLSRIRNAARAAHEDVLIPSSKIKENIAKILVEEGYALSYKVEEDGTHPAIKVGAALLRRPGTGYRRYPARLEARPPGLQGGGRAPACPGRSRCGDHLHICRCHDR